MVVEAIYRILHRSEGREDEKLGRMRRNILPLSYNQNLPALPSPTPARYGIGPGFAFQISGRPVVSAHKSTFTLQRRFRWIPEAQSSGQFVPSPGVNGPKGHAAGTLLNNTPGHLFWAGLIIIKGGSQGDCLCP